MSPRLPPDFLRIPLAHRALHDRAAGRPENSPAAVRAAVAAGYGIEIDLQLSADGVAMVFHDYGLKRLTGVAGVLRAHTAADLGRLSLLGSDEGIPTFREILDLVGGKVPLLVEIKDQDGRMGPDVGPLETAAAQAARGYEGPLAFMSFNPHSVAAIAARLPDRPCGLVTSAYRPEDWAPLPAGLCDRLREAPDFETCGASFISHEWRDLSRPRVAEIRATGAPVLCWTVRSAADEALARRIADNVTFEGYAAVIPAA
ncbi:MAG: glycerophosphodiester phosphodiesterase family protein [Gemmobacter sp.]